MSINRDRHVSLISRHGGLVTVMALTAIAIGIVLGVGAVDLYEAANGWVLQA